MRRAERLPTAREHVACTVRTLRALDDELTRVEVWGRELAGILLAGGRLLTCGNGGSAADAQHLTGELVGRYRDDRRPFSAIALHAESSTLTAIGNDYGFDEVFARQVQAHGRPGDVLVALSTSGTSPNVVNAAHEARRRGMAVWAMTGPEPGPLSGIAHAAVMVPSPVTATIQEVHGVLIHALCAAVDRHVVEDVETIPDLDDVAPPPVGADRS